MMTKKDFEALADTLRPVIYPVADTPDDDVMPGFTRADVIEALCVFLGRQNPQFDEARWRAYSAGGPTAARPVFYQHLRAPNSPNGNPQRLYMVYGSRGEVLRVVDEGYKGLPEDLRHVPQLPSVEIGRAEYHATKRQFSAQEA